MTIATEPAPLPVRLRNLRLETDSKLQIQRAMHLAAAKIEDLEDQVAQLAALLKAGGTPVHAPDPRFGEALQELV